MTDESIPTIARGLPLSKLRALAARAHTAHVKLSAIWREVGEDEGLKEVAGYAMCGAAEISAALKAAVRAHLQQVPATPALSTGDEM